MASSSPKARRSRLVARIYLYSLFSTAVAIGIIALSTATAHRQANHHHSALPRYFIERLARVSDNPAKLKEEAEAIARASRSAIRLYDKNGALLVAAGKTSRAIPDVTAAQLISSHDLKLGHGVGAHAIFRGKQLWAYGVVAMSRSHETAPAVGLTIGLVLLLLLGVSLLFARRLSQPLSRLANTAEALGAGDLSARTHLEGRDAFGRVGEAFDAMAERVAYLVRSQHELIANVSHELRTPLSRVRVLLDLIAEGGDAAITRQRLAEISTDLAELERLLDDVLTAARFDLREGSGLPMHTLEAARMADILDAAAKRFRARYGTSHVLEVEKPERSTMVLVDRALLGRALGNLLDNARKYSSTGSTIVLRADCANERTVAIEVTDHGVGISHEDQAQLFTPFFRGDRSRTRATGGVGLGLVIAKRIVEAHHGLITLTSAPGSGTRVCIQLPVFDTDEALFA